MNIRPARDSELDEIAELQQIVFRPDQPESHARYLTYAKEDPTYSLDHSRVVEVGGRLVAHLRVWDRLVSIGGVQLRAAGIGSLCVHPDFRKRGFAKALMLDSEQYFFQAGYDFGLLFTIIGTPYYEALNWIPIPLPTFAFEPGDVASAVTSDGLNVRSLEMGRDLGDVMRIYDAAGMLYSGSVVRDRSYWTSGPARIQSVAPQWVAFRDDQVVAYVNFEADHEEVWVKEVCTLPGDNLACADLASLVLAQCGGRRLCGSLPHNHPFVLTVETICQASAVWNTDDHMMVKGIHWGQLREKLGEEVVPVSKPEDEGPFWTSLLGEDVFYWETDVF